MSDLRDQLRQCIPDAGRAQITVAADLGVSQKHLSALLTGKAPLTLEWAERIAGACGCRVVTCVIPGDNARQQADEEIITPERAMHQATIERAEMAEDRIAQIAASVERSSARADDAEAARDRWRKRAKEAEAAVEQVRDLARQARGVSGALCTCRECESENWNPDHEPHEPTWTGWNLDPAAVLAALDRPVQKDPPIRHRVVLGGDWVVPVCGTDDPWGWTYTSPGTELITCPDCRAMDALDRPGEDPPATPHTDREETT